MSKGNKYNANPSLFGQPGESEKQAKPRVIKSDALQKFIFKKLNDRYYNTNNSNVEQIVLALINVAAKGDTTAAKMLLQIAYNIDKPSEQNTTDKTSIAPINWATPAKIENIELDSDEQKALGYV